MVKKFFQNIKTYLITKIKHLDLLYVMVATNFKMRYQNSVLGVVWVVIKPYVTFLVLYYVWSMYGAGSEIEYYPLYLLIGIIFYNYFQDLFLSGQMSLLDRAGIILKVSFPRQLAVLSALFNALITFLINSFLAIIIAIFTNPKFNVLGLLYFSYLAFILMVLIAGISFFTSVLTIRFRDLKNIAELVLFLLFWGTPIFYKVNDYRLTPENISLVLINPLTHLLAQVRAGFGLSYQIDISYAIMFTILSLFVFAIGWKNFNRRIRKVAEYF
ncbi:MAG: ABC transporter permease [Candidatus Dojkabacteria bacterium]|nr:ABC transporter permease [Candidatus Dojkabacteria bacterium]